MKSKIICLLFIVTIYSTITFSKNCELQTFVGNISYSGNDNELEISIVASDTINVHFSYWGNCFIGPCNMYDGQWYKNGVLINSGSDINVTEPGYYIGTVKMEGCYYQQSTGIIKLNVIPAITTPFKISASAIGLCTGDSTVLTVQNANSYQWSNGNTTQSISVFQDGIYNVTVVDANGISFTTPDTFIHFIAIPNVSFIALSDTFCISSEVKPVLNTDWNNEYRWTIDNTIQTGMQGNASIARATISGQYKIVTSNACGIDSASINVFIPPSNLYITPTDATVCANDSAHLVPSIPGVNYIWMNNNVVIPGATNADYYVKTNGGITVELTDLFGCFLSSYPSNINTDYQTMSLGPDRTFCPGSSITIDAPSGFGYYYWQDSTMNTSYLVTSPGIYSLSVIDGAQCTLTDSIVVNAYPSFPITLGNDTTICTSQSIILDAGPGFLSYEWNDLTVSRTHDAIYLGPGYEIADYYVTTVDINGCIESDSIRVVFDVCSSVKENEKGTIQLSSLSDNKFIILKNEKSFQENSRLQIFDNTGKIILDEDVIEKQILDLDYLSSGIYVFHISVKENVVCKGKLVVE